METDEVTQRNAAAYLGSPCKSTLRIGSFLNQSSWYWCFELYEYRNGSVFFFFTFRVLKRSSKPKGNLGAVHGAESVRVFKDGPVVAALSLSVLTKFLMDNPSLLHSVTKSPDHTRDQQLVAKQRQIPLKDSVYLSGICVQI